MKSKFSIPVRLCGDCIHFKTAIYDEPVCYEMTVIDGRKWARRRSPKKQGLR